MNAANLPVPIVAVATKSFRYRPRVHASRDRKRTLCGRDVSSTLKNPSTGKPYPFEAGVQAFMAGVCQNCVKVIEVDERAGLHRGQLTIESYGADE